MSLKELLFQYHRTIPGFISVFVFLLCQVHGQAQDKATLEKERAKIISQIEETNNYLKSTQKEKKVAVNDLNAIKKQVENRQKLIENIQDELEQANQLLEYNRQKRDSIGQAYGQLMKQYASILRYNYLQQLSNQKLSYLLSSESLNSFLLRYRYIKQFEAYQKTKEKELNDLRLYLVQFDEEIKVENEKRTDLMAMEKEQFTKLKSEQTDKDQMLKSLSQKEEQLKKDLKQKKKEREKLNQAIEAVILAQLKAAREKNPSGNLSVADAKLADDFSKNKGKLPWPIDKGFISTKFGKQPHPSLKGITIESNGVDITCTGSTLVKSIFEGEVVGITKVIGSQNMVIVSHGSYYTVYSNLADVNVRKGNKLKIGDVIGSLSSEKEKKQLHFEVWKGKNKLDPQAWIK
jgi:septal ring factor EnvC (AmiA/AmiB activator)